MEKFIYYNDLLEIYKELLTDKQQEIFTYYYAENLSLQEIADLLEVSKSFVGSSIKDIEKKLDVFEEKLSIRKRNQKIQEILNINDLDKIKKELRKL